MAECGLNKPEVARLPVEVHGKGVTRGVDCKMARDASLGEPVLEAQLHLASTQVVATARGEERIVIGKT